MSNLFQPSVNIDIPSSAVTEAPSLGVGAPQLQEGGEDPQLTTAGLVWPDLTKTAATWGSNASPPDSCGAEAVDGDDGLYGAAMVVDAAVEPHDGAAVPLAAFPTVTDVTRRYVNSVVSSIAANMPGFDGTTNALRMCPGAQVETQKDLKAPEGADEFSMAWFGIARALFTVVIAQETLEKAALRESAGGDGAAPLTLSVRDARKAFVSGLNSIVGDVIGGGGSPSFRRHGVSRFAYASEVEMTSKRMMEEWLAQGVLPEQLRAKYDALKGSAGPSAAGETTTGGVLVQSVQDLELILSADADTWVTSFFPLYQMLRRDGVGRIRPIWMDEATLRAMNKEELAYQIYALCSLKCLLKNKSGHTRGVAIPKAWLQRLLTWIVAVSNDEANTENGFGASAAPAMGADNKDTAVPSCKQAQETNKVETGTTKTEEYTKLLLSCPGPIDTFHCIHVAPGHPSKHWLLPGDRAEVDVIPERLFDYFTLLFGSGPRYLTYGDFTLQASFEAFLKPRPLMVEVTFLWEKLTSEARTEETVTVYVEDAVRRSDLAEVLRLALQLVREEKDLMSADKLDLFSAAVCGPNALIVQVKDINMEFLRPYMPVSDDARDITVSDVITRGMEFLKQRTGSVGASSSASLHQRTAEQLSFEVRLVTPEVEAAASAAAASTGSGEEESQQHSDNTKDENIVKYVVTPDTVARCGVCGLTNIGNTCYMNSALQCLSALRPFREHLLAFPVSKYPTASITSAYVRLLSSMWSGQYDYANTRELKDALGEKERRFAGYQQQDANELIEVMLDRMEEEVNDVSGRSYRERLDSDKDVPLAELSKLFWDNFLDNNTGFIPKDFFHQSKTVFRCLTCGEMSTVFDNNLTLSLNIKEPKMKRTMRVVALVHRPHLMKEAKETQEEEDQEKDQEEDQEERPASATDNIRVHLNLRVVSDAEGTVAEEDLKEALRQSLIKNADLRAEILSPMATTVDNDQPGADEVDSDPTSAVTKEGSSGPIELDYAVGLLEVPEQGTTYAFANCFIKGASPPMTAVNRKVPMAADDASTDPTPEFRVWYYLKDSHYGAPTAYGSLVYVEDLPVASESSETSDLLSAHMDLATSVDATKEELPREDQQSPEMTAAPPSRVMSRHITRRGELLAAALLQPVEDDNSERVGGNTTLATDYMMVLPSSSKPTVHLQAPKRLLLSVMHRRNRLTPLLDVTKFSKHHGDAWLYQRRQEAARSAGSFGPWVSEEEQGAESAGRPDKSKQPVTNVVIFLQYNGDEFDKVPIPTVDEMPSRKLGWGGGGGVFGGGRNSDDDDEQTCTLSDCLMRAMETDKLTGDDSWYCPKCKQFRETCVQRGLFRLPPCLVISFKRFKMSSYHADKNNTTVSFPTTIDFAPFLDKDARTSTDLNPLTQYKLRGVVYHSGSLSFGHYTASVFNDHLEKWVYCNDTSATVERNAAPTPDGAYILCYEQIVPAPK